MKSIKYILTSLTLAFSVILPASNAFAVDNAVSTLSATTSSSAISVSGTTIDGILAVAITIYDEAGTTLVAGPESTSVTSNAFSYSVAGTFDTSTVYTICAADYDGGSCTTVQTTVASSSSSSSSSTASTANTGTAPKASDSEDKAVQSISLGASIITASAILFGTHLVIKRITDKK